MTNTSGIKQLRLVVEAADYDQALAFYRDVLGMTEVAAFAEGDDDRVAILDAGRATLEIASPAHKRMVDRVETDGFVGSSVRVALEVDDAAAVTDAATAAGAELVAAPTETPWRSLNSRLRAPASLEVTFFQELEEPDQRTVRDAPPTSG
ncbi:VOC family protein [Nocardioides campestrisoli]|uniref:VOC family protein n=1 Tax=Nocardioides campestrisoli TaxID=2736757 RepID=UPI0015E65F84|nr:VOC family protein [Nocardioides campestrisoli]